MVSSLRARTFSTKSSAQRTAQHKVDTPRIFAERWNEERSTWGRWWWGWRMTWVGRVPSAGRRRKGWAVPAFFKPPELTTQETHSTSLGRSVGRGKKNGENPPYLPGILFPLVSDSYLCFCLYPYHLGFARMCLEIVPFSLVLLETWYSIFVCSLRLSKVLGRCLISYILR